MNKIVALCSSCKKCPVVEITNESVKIGEKDNIVTLTHDAFNNLKKKIIAGQL